MFRPRSWLMNLFAQKSKKEVVTNQLAQCINHAVENILENESLTTDLDDAAAEALLDWGVACAKMIAQSTVGLNKIEAEDVMLPRLRATRRLMRLMNRWGSKRLQMDVESNAALLTKVIEQAVIIYGKGFTPPGDERRDAFLKEGLVSYTSQFIANLRTLIESQVVILTNSEGTGD